jgi:hypothetical protein
MMMKAGRIVDRGSPKLIDRYGTPTWKRCFSTLRADRGPSWSRS